MADPLPEIHMPKPSFWPLGLALGATLLAAGVISSLWVSLVGLVLLFTSIGGWVAEDRSEGEAEAHHG